VRIMVNVEVKYDLIKGKIELCRKRGYVTVN
jgi:hypothetical protein